MQPEPKGARAMSWQELAALRRQMNDLYPGNRPLQNALAPLEHRAYARETVQDDPKWGVAKMGTFIPAYTALKFFQQLFGRKEWSDPSLRQAAEGYRGMWEGMK